MARKWITVIAVWIGILLYFGVGSSNPKKADLLLIIVFGLLLLAATIYTVAIWVRDQARGEPEKSYHLTAYPRWLLRFVFDEPESVSAHKMNRRPEQQQKPDTNLT